MRRRGLRSSKLQVTNHKSQIPQRGYMMITLMLALALIMLAMLAVVPDLRQQVQRDREEELRHRGSAYMRAVQHFYKKFSRYPTRVEELENTNNLKFLRKRYTDPINIDPATHKERDFKFLHQQDISLNNGPVLPGQSTPASEMGGGGQSIFGGGQGGPLGQSGLGRTQPGGFGGPQGGPGGFGAQPGGLQPTATGTPNSASGDSGNPSSGNSPSGNPSDAEGNPNSNGSSSNSNSSSGPNGQTFGGGPILGVASASKAKTIRVFFDKNHYNDWLFVYLPMADRGGLLTGPINPGMQTGNMGGLTPGQMPGGTPGQIPGQGGFGQGFGQGGTPFGGQNQAPQTPPPTPAPTPQQ